MVKFPNEDRVECLNEIRPGKICGAHLPAGKTWCPVCGAPTKTRRIASRPEDSREERPSGMAHPSSRTSASLDWTMARYLAAH